MLVDTDIKIDIGGIEIMDSCGFVNWTLGQTLNHTCIYSLYVPTPTKV